MSLPLFDVHGHCMPAAYRDAILASPIGKTARSLADNLVRKGVAVVVAGGGVPTALTAKAATTTIPIVFNTGEDPVRVGSVSFPVCRDQEATKRAKRPSSTGHARL